MTGQMHTGVDVRDAWISDTAQRLTDAGYVEQQAPGAPFRVMRKSEFRVTWSLSRLHTFVVLARTDSADASVVDRFVSDAADFAKATKGGLPRGFQTGIAVFPVLVAAQASPDAHARAADKPRKMWATMPIPILVEPAADTATTYSSRMLWGKVFQDYLGEQQRLIIGSLQGSSIPRSNSAYVFTGIMALGLALWLIGLFLVLSSG